MLIAVAIQIMSWNYVKWRWENESNVGFTVKKISWNIDRDMTEEWPEKFCRNSVRNDNWTFSMNCRWSDKNHKKFTHNCGSGFKSK